jgi:hypothetical protein
MDGQISHLTADGMTEFLRLSNGPLQTDTHIAQGYETAVGIAVGIPTVRQLSGFQLFLTTVMVGYVLINFTRMLQKKEMRG